MRAIELHLKFRIFATIIFVVNFIKESHAVVPDYCLANLNMSDCRMKPTPVFYYYKPGSRCEMAMWRGCPTKNMFKDQYLCSDMCIFKFLNKEVEDNTIVPYKLSKSTVKYSCEDTFKENRCNNEKRRVYTYDIRMGACIEATWRGCPTANKFPDLLSCQEHCMPIQKQDKYEEWKYELEAISQNDVDTIIQILDEISSKEIDDDKVKLKGNTGLTKSTSSSTKQTTTVSITETETASTTEWKASTTASTTSSHIESITPSTTESTTSSTTSSITSPATKSLTPSTTTSPITSTTAGTTPSAIENTTPSTIASTIPSTIASTIPSTIASTTSSTTASTTSSATERTTPSTTDSKIVSTPKSTTTSTILKVTVDSTELPEETQLLDYD
ncbi:hypothetical protein evm_000418 [Chilo suppressalis]|nr:hypothetical protein evm_000365 [Chilo suppressalis]RVE55051.1 hypothetical protein evm_000418 [Chilo suppressalis]